MNRYCLLIIAGFLSLAGGCSGRTFEDQSRVLNKELSGEVSDFLGGAELVKLTFDGVCRAKFERASVNGKGGYSINLFKVDGECVSPYVLTFENWFSSEFILKAVADLRSVTNRHYGSLNLHMVSLEKSASNGDVDIYEALFDSVDKTIRVSVIFFYDDFFRVKRISSGTITM